ncbi:hypothetical protein, partial [Gordonibacter sp.]|uniref:hypothetical protein n=1 Tax=Gordonibacter sp. TaxID=1968902 RepID=UPI002FCC1D00
SVNVADSVWAAARGGLAFGWSLAALLSSDRSLSNDPSASARLTSSENPTRIQQGQAGIN